MQSVSKRVAAEGAVSEPPKEEDMANKETGTKRKAEKVERPRRKRNRATKKAKASLYVGYVEDGETVEMIMKKFQKLEEIKSRKKDTEGGDATATGDQTEASKEMTEADLEEVFNETANFNLEKARTDGLQNYNYDQGMEVDEDGWDLTGVQTHETEEGEVAYFFGDGTDDDLWDELFGTKKSKKSRRVGVARGDKSVTKIAFVSDMHGRYVTGLRKIRKVDPNAIAYTKIPKKLPLSWAKVIKPYTPVEAIHTKTNWRPGRITCLETEQTYQADIPKESEMIVLKSVEDINLVELASKKENGFQGIVLSPPWKERFPLPDGSAYASNGVEPQDLLKLDLGNPKIIASGFVYVWTPKHLLHEVLKVMEKMNFFYVENAINVRQKVSNQIIGKESTYFRSSKETLLILRRGNRDKRNGKLSWTKVEIRHQRTSDVNFTYVSKDAKGEEVYAHSYIHNMVETMLPHGRYNPLAVEETHAPTQPTENPAVEAAWLSKEKQRKQQGRLLHLWAPPTVRRTGWISVAVAAG